ncbi:hypothetical protein DL95DRAFT_507130 [Leptodontidium sp. 2 PMI_412]|nr:hypothetical protein DL95DRAFT_507130 [Leptodontidium sp. 2 PMI_412]
MSDKSTQTKSCCAECEVKDNELSRVRADLASTRALLECTQQESDVWEGLAREREAEEAWAQLDALQEKFDLLSVPSEFTLQTLDLKMAQFEEAMLESERNTESLTLENTRLQKQLQEAIRKIASLPTKKDLDESQEELCQGKKKLQARIQQLEGEVRGLKRANAAMEALEVELKLVKHYRDAAKDEALKLRKELSGVETNLGSLELTAMRLERELDTTKSLFNETSRHLRAEVSKTDELSQQLAAAQETVNLADYPLDCYAKIRRRLFSQNRSDRHWINEEGNRMAHDSNLVADACMVLLNKLSPVDTSFMNAYYPPGSLDTVASAADANRLRSRGYAQELVDLRASMALEDTSTRIPALAEAFQKLDNACMAKWAELGKESMDDEEHCRSFNSDGEVHELILQMRRIRKRAAGKASRRVAYEEEPLVSGEVASVGSPGGVESDLGEETAGEGCREA